MNEQQVKKFIGEENWEDFYDWMRGQTCGTNKDGSLDFYDHDVQAFKENIDTGYDRQTGKGWD
jgi:hypothetical protein